MTECHVRGLDTLRVPEVPEALSHHIDELLAPQFETNRVAVENKGLL